VQDYLSQLQNVSKVEMIVDHSFLPEVLKTLDSLRVTGYTVIEDTSGKGDRGLSCSVFDCTYRGNYIMTVCTNEQQLSTVIEKINPILKKSGGICLVTPAKWIHY
jgi:nitrogen regulatory protein PII